MRVVYLLLALPLMVLLAACGGSDDGGDEADVAADNDAPNAGVIAVGNPAPGFTLPDAAGGDVSLSDYAGRPVLLYFHMAVG